MLRWFKALMLFFGAALLSANFANAQIAEIKAGISDFDEEIIGVGWALGFADENSIAINADVIFDEPKFLKWALSPQPYLGALINLEGKTSYGSAGLLWRQELSQKLYMDFSLGLAVHNGTLDINFQRGPSFRETFDRFDTEIEFGSRVLFKPQLSLGYRVTDEWAGEIYFEHLSHATLLDDKDNDGVDIVGIRAAKRF